MAREHRVTESVVPDALNHHHKESRSRELREDRYCVALKSEDFISKMLSYCLPQRQFDCPTRRPIPFGSCLRHLA